MRKGLPGFDTPMIAGAGGDGEAEGLVLPRRALLRHAATLPLLGLGLGACAARMSVADAFAQDRPTDVESGMWAAFYYAYTLYEFARVEQSLTRSVGNPGTINNVTRRSQLSDYRSRNVTAPNNDTIYSSCFLDLSSGPIELEAPTIRDRYFSIAFMDAFTDNFAYIGTRATGGEGGRFWIAGPGWQGTVPDGVRLFRSSTNDVWMLARVLVDGQQDLPAAEAWQQQIVIRVPEGRPPARGFDNAAEQEPHDPVKFLAVVNEMIRRSPGGVGQMARAPRFAAFGIGTDTPPPQALLDAWAQFLPRGIADLRQGFLFRDLVVRGWSYQPRGVGDFGENDQLRSYVALGGIAANSEQEAMYFHCNFDGNGERLSGANQYRWHIPPGGIPADGFWSLTMYETTPDGRYFLVENPIGRYSIGDRTRGLVREADGSTIILLQHEQPTGRLAPNWLPGPAGPMRLALRAYLPRPALIEREWRVPPLERV